MTRAHSITSEYHDEVPTAVSMLRCPDKTTIEEDALVVLQVMRETRMQWKRKIFCGTVELNSQTLPRLHHPMGADHANLERRASFATNR